MGIVLAVLFLINYACINVIAVMEQREETYILSGLFVLGYHKSWISISLDVIPGIENDPEK